MSSEFRWVCHLPCTMGHHILNPVGESFSREVVLRVARGLSRSSFRSPEASREVVRESREASGDSFESRERLWRSSFRSPEASRDVVCESREALTQLYCMRASCDSQMSRWRPPATYMPVTGGLSRLSNDFARGLWRL